MQRDLADEVAWDEAALAAFAGVRDDDLTPVGIARASGMAPSLHLDLGDGYLRQGRVEDAAVQLGLAQSGLGALGDDGYVDLIRGGVSRLADRLTEPDRPPPECG